MPLGTRWASWNIGVFLCIRCGGLHRKLGTHISRVKSVTLDSWTEEEVQVFAFYKRFLIVSQSEAKAMKKSMGSIIPTLLAIHSHLFRGRPHFLVLICIISDMEQYIRDKYERKLFMNTSGRSSSNGHPTLRPSTFGQSGNRPGHSNAVYFGAHKAESEMSRGIAAGSGIDDPFGDFDSTFSTPSHNLVPRPTEAMNGWTEMEVSKPPANNPVQTPAAVESTIIADDFKAETSFPVSAGEDIVLHPQFNSSTAPSFETQSTGISNSFITSQIFQNEDDDPFKELTHNPFK